MQSKLSKVYIDVCPICSSKNISFFLTCKDWLVTKDDFNIMKCVDCNFAFTQDFPAEDEIGKYYDVPQYISHSDTKAGLINFLYHWARRISLKSKSDIIFNYASQSSGSLLDIGSGTGYFLNVMRKNKWIVTGIEKSESAKKYAKQIFDIDCQDQNYLYMISEKKKDVITMWHVLEHLEHLNEVMAHLSHILKDDGLLVIALPNKNSYDAKSYKQDWAAYDVPRHLWHFSPSDFKYLADKHKFEIVAIKPMHFDTFYISMLSEQNKGSFLSTLVGLIKGGVFFLRSLFNKQKCSSLIYILKKNNK